MLINTVFIIPRPNPLNACNPVSVSRSVVIVIITSDTSVAAAAMIIAAVGPQRLETLADNAVPTTDATSPAVVM